MGGSTVWLVGMMGAGKSAVGRLLAERLGRAFCDSDAEVERAAGASIPQIFEREGEAGFRRREREAVEALAGRAAVVALGGGAVAQPGVAERLGASGTVVYLRARPATLVRRIGGRPGRPLLAGLDEAGRLERIERLLADREIHYGRADVVVDTDELGVDATCAAIEAVLDATGSPAPGPSPEGPR